MATFLEYLKNVTEEEIEDFHKKIASNVRRVRKEKGRTQLDLALSIGFKSATFIGNAEACRGGKHFSIVHLYQIAKELDVGGEEFFR